MLVNDNAAHRRLIRRAALTSLLRLFGQGFGQRTFVLTVDDTLGWKFASPG
jgi:hypothetical protein